MTKDILRKASEENWILITNDKGFGERIYRERHPHRGVVLLRLDDERAANKTKTLGRQKPLVDCWNPTLASSQIDSS